MNVIALTGWSDAKAGALLGHLLEEGGGDLVVSGLPWQDLGEAYTTLLGQAREAGHVVHVQDRGDAFVFQVRKAAGERRRPGPQPSAAIESVRAMKPGDELVFGVHDVNLQSLRNEVSRLNHGSPVRRAISLSQPGKITVRSVPKAPAPVAPAAAVASIPAYSGGTPDPLDDDETF
jgi:hypothetical protein